MTQPKPAYPGATYLLTRRCVQRQFWLLPTPMVEAYFSFALALAVERHGVALHNALVLGNHWHAVFTDPRGVASEFARDVHALVARCLNAHLERRESIWSSDGVSLVRLVGPEAVFASMVYTEVNAVAAGLVSSPEGWEGLRVSPGDALRAPRIVERPRAFFRKGSGAACPERVQLKVTLPACFEGEGAEALVERFGGAVAERVKEIRTEMEASGRSFLGMRRVRARARGDRPDTVEARRRSRPMVACRDPERRKKVLAQLAQFCADYHAARAAWLAGKPNVTFPHGTYQMRAYPNVVLARPPDAPRAAA